MDTGARVADIGMIARDNQAEGVARRIDVAKELGIPGITDIVDLQPRMGGCYVQELTNGKGLCRFV